VTGQYAHNIDAKGRLFIPARLREELGQTFHVTVGLDHCLSIYSDESWATFTDKVRALPYSKAKALRPLFANAVDCEPDAQGRILIPTKLREYAGLQKEVVVIGSFDRAEIWNAERWAREEAMALWSRLWKKWGCEPWDLTATPPTTRPSAISRSCWTSAWTRWI